MVINDELNPKIWNSDKTLKDGVKEAVLRVANQFVNELKVPKDAIEVVDVRLVGSNASYNYGDKSDLDIHVVMNTDIYPGDSSLLKLYFDSVRNRFNKEFTIEIKGLPVEVSVEDMNGNVASNGIYSVYEDKWIKEPTKIDVEVVDVTQTEQYQKLVDEIKGVLDNPTSDNIKKEIDKLYMIRKNSILIDGEYGQGNLLFKAIRDEGLLQELKTMLYKILSKELTFEQLITEMRFSEAMELSEG